LSAELDHDNKRSRQPQAGQKAWPSGAAVTVS
jgi:hypothetical protein